jgi:4-diphosphocytidyl-2-C-methyl-D-erythritol kinase
MQAEAFAKVNLSLRVRPRDDSGWHPLHSLALSVDWADRLGLEDAEDDALIVDGLPVPEDESNMAWRAVEAVRGSSARPAPVALHLEKRIPVAAGLGGGSADAAAALILAGARFRVPEGERSDLAVRLGADVPFCLLGGLALMEGYGEHLSPLPALQGCWLAVVVPPFEMVTAEVYRRWDRLDGPEGPAVDGGALPPALRDLAPLANDLLPAAVSLAPDLGDWVADLQRRWGQAVLMSGSGPALFGLFSSAGEADEAVAAAPGARAVRACRPVPRGWRVASGTLP